MRLLIRVEGEATGRTLLNWLRSDQIANEVEISPVAGRPGQMGAELVQAVINNGLALSSLIFTVVTWWDSRRRTSGTDVGVRIETDDVEVSVTGSDPAEVRRIVETLTRNNTEITPP